MLDTRRRERCNGDSQACSVVVSRNVRRRPSDTADNVSAWLSLSDRVRGLALMHRASPLPLSRVTSNRAPSVREGSMCATEPGELGPESYLAFSAGPGNSCPWTRSVGHVRFVV